MKLIVDQLNALGGWTSNGLIANTALNYHADFLAELNSASVMLNVPADQAGKYAEKTYNVDATGYTEIVLSVYSARLAKDSVYERTTDYSYKVDFGFGVEYYLPCYSSFTDLVFAIPEGVTISRIRITALTNEQDVLILNHLVLAKDELELDMFQAIREALEYDIADYYGPDGILVGTGSATAGDTYITRSPDDWDWAERYSLIKIKDLTNEEVHNIEQFDTGRVGVGELGDGTTIANTFAGANVYLQIPVRFGVNETEIFVPSISIWGLTSRFDTQGEYYRDYDTHIVAGNTKTERRTGQLMTFSLLIDVEARHNQLLTEISGIVRRFLGRGNVWVNGRKFDLAMPSPPVAPDVPEAIDIIPKVQYTVELQIKEDLWKRTTLNPTTAINLSASPTLLP